MRHARFEGLKVDPCAFLTALCAMGVRRAGESMPGARVYVPNGPRLLLDAHGPLSGHMPSWLQETDVFNIIEACLSGGG